MKVLHQRLQAAFRAARTAPLPRDETAPFGFATRVVASLRNRGRHSTVALLWQELTLRALGCVMLALIAVVALSALSNSADTELQPRIADTVGDALWIP